MITNKIKIHDKTQFELNLVYNLNKNSQHNSYEVESYFFIPRSLDINSQTYRKEMFYGDLQNYIRFKTPNVNLKLFLENNNSPFLNLMKSIDRLVLRNSNSNQTQFETQVKMFCSILRTSINNQKSIIYDSKDSKIENEHIKEFIKTVKRIEKKYRSQASKLRKIKESKDLKELFDLGDEAMSFMIEDGASDIIRIQKKKKHKSIFRSELITLITDEINHRKNHKFTYLSDEFEGKEGLIYKKSVLKKFISSAMFVHSERKNDGKIIEQVVFSLAAGLAMIFAAGVTLFSQQKYGTFAGPVFMIAVISYMFKDRIKDISKILILKKLSKYFADYKTKLFQNDKEVWGKCKESFDFISESAIPNKILKKRKRKAVSNLGIFKGDESIIRYHKEMQINMSKFSHRCEGYPIVALHDIIRFDISSFLKKMASPKKSIYVLNTDDELEKIYGQKVYHISMLLKFKSKDREEYTRYRLILNKDGIKRIEEK